MAKGWSRSCSMAGDWDKVIFKVPFSLISAVILWFHGLGCLTAWVDTFSLWMKRAEGRGCCLVGTVWIYNMEGWKPEEVPSWIYNLEGTEPEKYCRHPCWQEFSGNCCDWKGQAAFGWAWGVVLRCNLIDLWKGLCNKTAMPRTWKSFFWVLAYPICWYPQHFWKEIGSIFKPYLYKKSIIYYWFFFCLAREALAGASSTAGGEQLPSDLLASRPCKCPSTALSPHIWGQEGIFHPDSFG